MEIAIQSLKSKWPFLSNWWWSPYPVACPPYTPHESDLSTADNASDRPRPAGSKAIHSPYSHWTPSSTGLSVFPVP